MLCCLLTFQSQKQDRQSQAMQIFNLSTLEQFPNIFQVNMRAPPEAVRTQIQQLLVDRMVKNINIFSCGCLSNCSCGCLLYWLVLWLLVQPVLWLFVQLALLSMILKVRRMSPEERDTVMSFVDRAEENGGQKTPWGVFLTNALPLGEIRIISLFLLSCSFVCPQIFGWLISDLGSYNKMGIFPTVARINHSCKPNAHHFFNPDTGEEEVFVTLIINSSTKLSSWSPALSSPPSCAISNIIIITAILQIMFLWPSCP